MQGSAKRQRKKEEVQAIDHILEFNVPLPGFLIIQLDKISFGKIKWGGLTPDYVIQDMLPLNIISQAQILSCKHVMAVAMPSYSYSLQSEAPSD